MAWDDEPEDDARRDADLDIIKRHVAQIAEHFEVVQVFASKHNPSESGGTTVCCWGSGHWYARYGQIREWTIKQEADFIKGD